MDYFYLVMIVISVLTMLTLTIDIGTNTILSLTEIKLFRITFITLAVGATCEFLGYYFDVFGTRYTLVRRIVTVIEFSISPVLTILFAKSCGLRKSIKPMAIFMFLHFLCQVLMQPLGGIFSVDENGRYIRGPFYWIYLVVCAVSFFYLLFVFVYLGKRGRSINLIKTILLILIVLIGQVACFWDDSIRTGYISLSIAAVFLYLFVQEFIRIKMLNTIEKEHELSSLDSLTGVKSRIGYDRKIVEIDEILKINKNLIHFAICECDLNNLKQINDTYGHEAGDLYIKRCCKAICSFFKHSPIFRIGGDEFVVLLQNEDYEVCDELKQNLLNLISEEVQKDCALTDKVSFAAGFSKFNPAADNSFKEVFARADKEMYAHKRELKK